MKFSRVALVLASTSITALALTGCAGGGVALPGIGSTPTPEKVFVTAPLTGVKYEQGTPEANGLTGPSVACKVDNSEAARPQQNLNKTDMVFDEMVEGGLTRFVAVFHSQLLTTDVDPKAVGVAPVRSIRPMDPDIISQFGGIVCYSGGQLKFVNMMRATKVFNASETSEQGNHTFSRLTTREAPHNVQVNVKLLAANHPEIVAPQQGFDFAGTLEGSTAVAAGNSVSRIKVAFPSALAEWVPSADGKQWLRIQDGKVDTDSATKEQLHATNVVVLDVQEDRSYADPKYGHIPKAVLIGKGKAWVFTGGKYVDAFWSKANQTARIILTDAKGAAINLAPGNTWVELKPADPEGKLTIVAGAGAKSASPSASPTH
jgi:Protein of unknown function (DUF3048) N-terminal domain/Protein of unknown function (DUF3048) C-terminal domain